MRPNINSLDILQTKNDDFFRRVHEAVLLIPYGKVTTYGHIAAMLGSRSSARIVGFALNAVTVAERKIIPCHRVVNRNGELTGKMHFESPFAMRRALEDEGVEFRGECVNMAKHLWIPEEVL